MAQQTDIHGAPVELGKWYWAMDRRGKIRGVGKFAVYIGHTDATFFLDEVGFTPDSRWQFVKAEEPCWVPKPAPVLTKQDVDYFMDPDGDDGT